jgi:nitroreductase
MTAAPPPAYRPIPLPDRQAFSDPEALARAAAFRDYLRRRHSVRDFADRPVPQAIIEACIAAAASAPSGANQQPWHFVAVRDPAAKARIRAAAEEEERAFYAGGGGDEWIRALAPIGTGPEKPHLTIAPWLIVVFAERHGLNPDGSHRKNYYVPESVGIATGFLIAALHQAGLVTLTHTPNPMRFLNGLLGRPAREKPVMILPVGHPAEGATVPAAAKVKKPLAEVMTVV